jgi:Uma2 family endonuclease
MSTAMKPTTAKELELLPDDGFLYELIQGELIQMSPAGEEHGTIGYLFGWKFGSYFVPQNLGRGYSSDTGFTLAEPSNTVLASDFAFIRADRLPLIIRRTKYIEIHPNLVLEVLSPTDQIVKLKEKAKLWLDFGTPIVVTINPRRRETTVYRSCTDVTVLTYSDTLEFPDLAPGWSLTLSELFQ